MINDKSVTYNDEKILNPRLSYINITLNVLLTLLLDETMIFYFASKVYIKKTVDKGIALSTA